MDLTETMSEDGTSVEKDPSSPALGVGQSFGRFRIDRVLGTGGFGAVYDAFDTELQRNVALKVLFAAGGDQERALLREARALARVDHPHLVRVIDVGKVEGQIVMAMERVEGTSFGDWVQEKKPPWTTVVEVVAAVADALAAAHGAGLVHRDIKPANIMMTPEGAPVVVDFGLAVATGMPVGTDDGVDGHHLPAAQPTRNAGTPAYMAPEQMEGGRIDARADQYALALVLYEGLTGDLPFELESPALLYGEKKKGSKVAFPAPIPVALSRVVERALSAAPNDRYPYLSEFRAQLGAVVGNERRERRIVRVVGVGAAAFLVPAILAIFIGSTSTTGWVASVGLVLTLGLARLSMWLGQRGVSGIVRGSIIIALVNTAPFLILFASTADIHARFALASWSTPLGFGAIILISTLMRTPWLPVALALEAALLSYVFIWVSGLGPEASEYAGPKVQFFRALQLLSFGFIAAGAAWILRDHTSSRAVGAGGASRSRQDSGSSHRS